FSNGQFSNPMVVRIAGLGYQKGFGGHFHNDNSLAVLRDIPGIVIGCPSDGAEAVRLHREAVRLAREDQRVVVIVEPIAQYTMRDLLAPGDGQWMCAHPDRGSGAPLGEVAVRGTGTDIAIVTYGNGVHLGCQVMADLKEQGISARVVDLRWLAPLPKSALLQATADCTHLLIVDECRRTGAQGFEIATLFYAAGRTSVGIETAQDSFIATGPAYGATLPSRSGIRDAALRQIKAKP
ncbi:MAG: transketolase C-terminal domain-containing protein, partial [Pseudomonadota bacterium]